MLFISHYLGQTAAQAKKREEKKRFLAAAENKK
jgi:hypothetical protein